jgi:hypothetical protein
LPVVDNLASEYGDEVAFIAVAYASTFDKTAAGAARLMPSGVIRWGLDEHESVRGIYGISGQPWTVLISASGQEVDRWPGARSEDQIRASLDALIEY